MPGHRRKYGQQSHQARTHPNREGKPAEAGAADSAGGTGEVLPRPAPGHRPQPGLQHERIVIPCISEERREPVGCG